MKTKGFAAVLITAAAFAAMPASAQSLDGSVNQMATRIGMAAKLSAKPEAAVNGDIGAVNEAKDPFKPVGYQQMASTMAAGEAAKYYSLSTKVDYDGDGVQDVVYMAQNSAQVAVVVQLGNGKGKVFAYRAKGQWGGGNEIMAAGKRRILINYPGSSIVVLSAESGRPAAYFYGE